LKWPIQGFPSSSDWTIWSNQLAFLETGWKLTTPLGKWISQSHQTWERIYCPQTETFFEKDWDRWLATNPCLKNSLRSATFDTNSFYTSDPEPLEASPVEHRK